MSYQSHAALELKALGYNRETDTGPNRWVYDNLMELLDVFDKQEHSGASASYVIDAFSKLSRFQPLSPLTGEDWEWGGEENGIRQNKRCSTVFKDVDGRAYNIDGRVFQDSDGHCWTSINSRVYVTFPYTPKTVYCSAEMDVAEEAV